MKRVLIGLASTLWSATTAGVRLAIRMGVVKPTQLPARVISVGNIQVGGAGKTPLVAKLAREACDRGLKTCILTRGYKGQWESKGGVVLPGEVPVSSLLCGDEAALLHDLCPKAYLGVGANRIQQFQAVLERAGQVDLVILDDGFQNWKIQKDLEIVALTSLDFTQVLFRDWRKALAAADLLVWTKGEKRPVSYGKPLVRVKYRIPAPSEKNPVWLVTGIADGRAASQLVIETGYLVQHHIELDDHEAYDEKSVKRILRDAAEKSCKVALTGKDWVKWRDLGVSRSEVTVLEPDLIFEEGSESWSRILWGK